MMRPATWFLVIVVGIVLLAAIMTFPIWGMGAAVFLDADRSMVSREVSPDGRRVAQIDRLVVGGVPSIVVMIRDTWMPDWYLAGCAATSHYEEIEATVRWVNKDEIEVSSAGGGQRWSRRSTPFHDRTCDDVSVKWLNSAH